MSDPTRDPLDQAIDRVAARLVSVDHDQAMVERIVAALPDRVSWFGWLFHSWAPRLAAVAMIVTAGMLWNRTRVTPTILEPIAVVATTPAITPLLASVEPELNRTKPLELLEPLERMEPAKVDFDRSLAALAAPEALGFRSLSPDSLPAEDALAIASLAVADLPLTSESFSPR